MMTAELRYATSVRPVPVADEPIACGLRSGRQRAGLLEQVGCAGNDRQAVSQPIRACALRLSASTLSSRLPTISNVGAATF